MPSSRTVSGRVRNGATDHDGVDNRLELLKAISLLVSDADLRNESLESVTARIESLTETWTGHRASISWNDTDDGDDTATNDDMGGSRLVSPILAAKEHVGWLTLISAEVDGLNEQDQLFATVAARCIGAVRSVHLLRLTHQLSALFDAAFDSTQVGMQLVDPDGTYRRVNTAFADMLGYRRSELVGRRWQEFSPDSDDPPGSSMATGPATHAPASDLTTKRYERADGSIIWAKENVAPVYPDGHDHPETRMHLVQVVDITSQVAATEEERRLRLDLADSERRYLALLATAVDYIFRVDVDAVVLELNEPARDAFVQAERVVIGREIGELLPEHVALAVAHSVRVAATGGTPNQLWREWIETPSGSCGWFTIRVIAELTAPDEQCNSVFVVASDVSELVESEQRLATLALVDTLTGTSNRAAVFDRLQHALDRLERNTSGIAVAVLDVDHLKAINDTYGHRAGDESLIAVAARLRTAIRPQDSLGRVGGDEFVVVLEDVSSAAQAERLGERLSNILASATIVVGVGGTRSVSASIGVSWTSTPTSIDELMGRADRAMYEAKRHGRGRSWFERPTDGSAEMPSNSADLRELSTALLRNQFELHYQPIVARPDGGAVAVEALIRWRHPERGLLTPNYFLGALLASGQIGPVGLWVCRAAIRQLATWQADPLLRGLTIHVNVSPGELANPALSPLLRQELADAAVPPELLCVEVTELALADTVVSTSTLAELATTGVRLMLDDFGTGVSSLTHLRARPLHGIKIDRTFVQGAADNPGDRAIVEGVVSIAAGLGVDVIAEGVETAAQAAWLATLGPVMLQGFLFSRAVPANQMVDLVAQLGSAEAPPRHPGG